MNINRVRKLANSKKKRMYSKASQKLSFALMAVIRINIVKKRAIPLLKEN